MPNDHHGVTLATFSKTVNLATFAPDRTAEVRLLGSIVATTQTAIYDAVRAEMARGKTVALPSLQRIEQIAWQRLQTFNKNH
jgi:hypothetical protein